MSRDFDRFMVHVDIGTDEKLAGLSDAERLCHIAGVLAIAAKAPIRGCLLVGDAEAQPRHVAKRADVSERVAKSTLAKLQEAGVLLRDDDLGCLRVHNWSKFNPDPKKDGNAARRQALHRDLSLRTTIRDRDQDRCRYCGTRVSWTDRRGPHGGTYDHLDPGGPNAPWNLVVACRGCNSSKCAKTVEEAGMVLLPEPSRSSSNLALSQVGGGSEARKPAPEVEGRSKKEESPPSPPVGGRGRDTLKWREKAVEYARLAGVDGDEETLCRAVEQATSFVKLKSPEEFRTFAAQHFGSLTVEVAAA